VPNSDICRQVCESYERRPYPTPDRSSIARSGHQLPPFAWIRAICAIPQLTPTRILVAGCGTGPEAITMKKKFPNAEVVGVDFSSKSINQAKALHKRVLSRSPIRLMVGDITNRKFMTSLGANFDFISCHGVLTYIPQPEQALRNLSSCLSENGALYLGVNGQAHFSQRGRPALKALGFDVRKVPSQRRLRRILRLYDALSSDPDGMKADLPFYYLASDLFGPFIHNLSLPGWIRLCHDAGLSFAGDYYAFRKIRDAINAGILGILRPRSREAVHKFVERLHPRGFYQLAFTKRPTVSPAWDKNRMLNLCPARTRLYQAAFEKRRRLLRLKSVAINTLVELDCGTWEKEFLQYATGKTTLSEILRKFPRKIAWNTMRDRLYIFYHLAVINFE
jgi:SAM-dependent methyltransferase